MSFCPNVDALKAFAVGNLSGASFARIATHLESCRACEATLQAFDDHADGLITGLGNLAASGRVDGVGLPETLLAAARQSSPLGHAAKVGVDLGKRFARQLANGACQLGKFALEAEVGAGSFGYVFRAH